MTTPKLYEPLTLGDLNLMGFTMENIDKQVGLTQLIDVTIFYLWRSPCLAGLSPKVLLDDQGKLLSSSRLPFRRWSCR
jgi:hypothetical protein